MMRSDCYTWKPRHGILPTMALLLAIALVAAAIFLLIADVYAQDKALSPPDFDWHGLLMMMIPSIWAAMGPVLIKGITASVNNFFGQYVPRPVQVIVSSILGALAAGLAGDAGSTATQVAAAGTALAGGASQIYAATQPYKLHADPPPQGVAP